MIREFAWWLPTEDDIRTLIVCTTTDKVKGTWKKERKAWIGKISDAWFRHLNYQGWDRLLSTYGLGGNILFIYILLQSIRCRHQIKKYAKKGCSRRIKGFGSSIPKRHIYWLVYILRNIISVNKLSTSKGKEGVEETLECDSGNPTACDESHLICYHPIEDQKRGT